VRPVDAASLILIDRGGGEPRFLMGRRHEGHVFMPGHMVFPGGRVDPSDRRMRALRALAEPCERRLLVGETRAHEAAVPPGWDAFANHGVQPSLAGLRFIARAITPPRFPRRFDTRFFAAEATAIGGSAGPVAGPDAELVTLSWLSLAEAEGENLAEITRTILREAVRRLEAGLDEDRPVPVFSERHGRWLRSET